MNAMTSSKNSGILLITALVAAILFAVYYYVLTPKLDEVEAKENNLSTLHEEMANLQQQLDQAAQSQQMSVSNELVLRKKVPPMRAIEKVLADVEEIEEITGTRIESISFNNYDSLVSDSTIQDVNAPQEEAEQPTTETTEETPTEEQATTEALPVSSIAKESLPPALKLVTFEIQILALDMKSLHNYLEEIEKLERVMKIDTVSIKLPGEEDVLQEDGDSTVQATVQITTFYYDGDN